MSPQIERDMPERRGEWRSGNKSGETGGRSLSKRRCVLTANGVRDSLMRDWKSILKVKRTEFWLNLSHQFEK